ncbi:hypothetical protein D3D01_10840 [Haloarcula sp. Atlit-7R]|nr:hypothetical protein D3D01_10840 [Haloarcula sp. Atlit-7R]
MMNESEALSVFDGMRTESPASIENYKTVVRRFIKHHPDVYEVTTDEIAQYLEDMLNDGYADKTVDAARTGLIKFFGQLDRDDDPTDSDKLDIWSWYQYTGKTRKTEKKEIIYLEKDEINKLIENLPAPVLRNELIVRLMFETGLRATELCTLKVEDLDTDSRRIDVIGGKGNKDRTVYYDETLDTLLEIWLVDRQGKYYDNTPYLFPTNRSEHISQRRLADVINKGAEKAGIQETLYVDKSGRGRKRVTPHTIRHSFAMACLNNGMPIKFLQELMGHDRMETTEVYLNALDTDVEKSYRRWGPQY